MMAYLQPALESVRNVMKKGGKAALYETISVDGISGPAYQMRCLLDHEELKHVLFRIEQDECNLTKRFS